MALFTFDVATLLPNLAEINQPGYCSEEKGKQACANFFTCLQYQVGGKEKITKNMEHVQIPSSGLTLPMCTKITKLHSYVTAYQKLCSHWVVSWDAAWHNYIDVLVPDVRISDTGNISGMCIYPFSKASKHPQLLVQICSFLIWLLTTSVEAG